MGSFNCTGFHSRLPITGGDEEEISKKLNATVNEKLGLPAGEYLLTQTFDHRFVYEEIAAMKLPWDW